MNTKEAVPQSPANNVDDAMRLFEEKEKEMSNLSERGAKDIAQLTVDAEELDKRLPEALALNVENNPEIVQYLKEHQMPQWHQISHAVEEV